MYQIVVKRIEEKEVEETEYKQIWKWKDGNPEWGYVKIPNMREVETELYRQKIDCEDFNLKSVIDSFNQ